jgi:hypothetical protein
MRYVDTNLAEFIDEELEFADDVFEANLLAEAHDPQLRHMLSISRHIYYWLVRTPVSEREAWCDEVRRILDDLENGAPETPEEDALPSTRH